MAAAVRRLGVVALAAALLTVASAAASERDLFGYLERVVLVDAELEVPAKLDTGADTSSLDATDIRRFRRRGVSWVRFTVADPGGGDGIRLERPLLRRVRIKQHEGESQRRPVVELTVCLGDHRRKVEFSLIDRSHFDYQVLLGRSALAGIAVVDPDETYLSDPGCEDEGR